MLSLNHITLRGSWGMIHPEAAGRRALRKFIYTTLGLIFVFITCARTLSASKIITVRLLDAKTGKPLAKNAVTLTVSENGKVVFRSHSNTNSNGVAVFNLPEPIPERIGLTYATADLGTCSDVEFPTGEILTAGLVSKNRCYAGKLPRAVTARPGEIILFGSPLTFWERTRREIP